MSVLSRLKEKLRRKRSEEIEIQGVSRPKKTEKIKRVFTVGRGIRKAEERSARRIELLMQEAKTRREARKLYNVLKKEGFDVSLSEVESYIKYRQKKKERRERVVTLLERTGAPKEVVSLFKNKKERDLFEELVSENGRKKRKGKRGKKGKGKVRKSRNKKGKSNRRKSMPMILRW